MMNQFQVIDGYLTVVDTQFYDFWWGFRKPIKKLW